MGPVRKTFIWQSRDSRCGRLPWLRSASTRGFAVTFARMLASQRAVPWFIAALILPVYLAFPTRNYNWDGIDFALAIENSGAFVPALIHPHHLIYNAFGLGVHRVLQGIGYDLRAIQSLQIANSILGALSVGLLFTLLREMLRSAYLSGMLIALFAFSATWWRYSTDASPYVPSILLLLACANLALTARTPWPFTLALLHSISMCFHQIAVLFYPVIVLALFCHRADLTRRDRGRAVLKYTVSACSLTALAYFYGFHLQTGKLSLPAFLAWITSYLHGAHSYSFGFDLWSNLGYTLRGHLRLFFGGRIAWIQGLINLSVGGLIASLFAVMAVFLLNMFRCARGRSSTAVLELPKDQYPHLTRICALWIAVYLSFLFFWYPHFTPYRMFYLPALLLLVGTVLARYRILCEPTRKWCATMFVAGLTISNFLFLIFPLSHVDRNPPLAFTMESTRGWPAGTVVYYQQMNSDNQMLRYFGPRTTWKKVASVNDIPEPEIENAYRAGSSVWMETSAYEQLLSPAGDLHWVSDHTRVSCRHELITQKYRIRLVQLFPSGYAADVEWPGCMQVVHK
jgi:hypothetical protein